jgi:hypothetical protein
MFFWDRLSAQVAYLLIHLKAESRADSQLLFGGVRICAAFRPEYVNEPLLPIVPIHVYVDQETLP